MQFDKQQLKKQVRDTIRRYIRVKKYWNYGSDILNTLQDDGCRTVLTTVINFHLKNKTIFTVHLEKSRLGIKDDVGWRDCTCISCTKKRVTNAR